MTTAQQTQACEIAIDPNGIHNLIEYFRKLPGSYTSIVLLSDDQVYPLYGHEVRNQLTSLKIPIHSIVVKAGEPTKTISTAVDCWSQMQTLGLDRKSLIVSLGGGMVSDLSGFVASCYMRGIDIVHLPTTIMGMVDAAIGGKNAINLPNGKNLIGTFHHPKLVLIDPTALKTLNKRQIRAGLAEVIKIAVIFDPELFAYLNDNMDDILDLQPEKMATIIAHSCQIKADVVRRDEKDLGVRSLLNYGHTFGHAIETATDYKTYLHGEAVAIGMSCAAHLSHRLGYIKRDFISQQDALIQKAGLSTELPNIPLESFVDLMANDKKAEAGKISLIIAQGIGKAIKVSPIDKKTIIDTLKDKKENRLLSNEV